MKLNKKGGTKMKVYKGNLWCLLYGKKESKQKKEKIL